MDLFFQDSMFNNNHNIMDMRYNNIFIDKAYIKKVKPSKNAMQIEKTISFTGSRPNNLPWKDDENSFDCINFKQDIKKLLLALIEKGFDKFIVGMAMGFDMIMAEIILEIKQEYTPNIMLECAIPFEKQSHLWTFSYKKRYNNILKQADKITYVSYDYFAACYHVRNHYMVNNSSLVIAGLFSLAGGTESTVKYALQKNKNIIIITK